MPVPEPVKVEALIFSSTNLACAKAESLNTSKKAHGEVQKNHALINPHIGMRYNKNKWAYTFECKFLQMNKKNKPNVPDYVGINQHGALGMYLNFTRKF